MTENELRAFLRASPDRVFSTRELGEHFPRIKTQAGALARRFPDLIHHKEAFTPTRGFAKGKLSHHYFWQDNPAIELPLARVRRVDGEHAYLHQRRHPGDNEPLEGGTMDGIAAAIREDLNSRYDDLNVRVERLERIARMIGHDL